MSRAPRNIISRTRELSLRAAELLDDGLFPAEVAMQLNEEFGCAVSERTVNSFRVRLRLSGLGSAIFLNTKY